MPPKKERYNAKGRQSTAGGSTHKKKKSNAVKRKNETDSNVEIIIPQEEREKREELNRQRQQLLASTPTSTGPISSKKRKRLDNFIQSRLKKENHTSLIEKLAKSSAEVSDRSGLLSASTLGTGKALSGSDRIDKSSRRKEARTEERRDARGKGKKKGLAGKVEEKLKRQREEDEEDRDLDESDQEEGNEEMEIDQELEGGEEEEGVDERQSKIAKALSKFSKPQESLVGTSSNNTVLGSALARGPDGQIMLPVMKQRKKKKTSKQKQKGRNPGSGTSWGRLGKGEKKDEDQKVDSDSSFDSSESENEEEEGIVEKEIKGEISDQMDLDQKLEEGEEEVSSNEDEVLSHEEDLSGESDEDSEGGEDDEGTDEDEEAIFMEAMRQRGLLPDGKSFKVDSKGKGKEKAIEEMEREGSLPWEGFEDENPNVEEDRNGDDEDENQEDEDEDEDEDEESQSGSEEEEEERSKRRGIAKTKKSSGFKDWAREALGFGETKETPSNQEDDHHYTLEPIQGFKQRVGDLGPQDGIARGPLGDSNPETTASQTPFSKFYYSELEKKDGLVKNVHVERSEEQKEERLKLPVVKEEERVVRMIMENMVCVICGETGSGKTTQVPQFLFERGFGDKGSDNPGMVGITQPRRVAALSMASRVASELSLPSNKVSHQIRYDATVSKDTAVKFMTDGVLLRELSTDFLLEKYSVILIDEAHERSLNTDVLVGTLSRVVKLRAERWMNWNQEEEKAKGSKATERPKPLRLIIMSATLKVSDFTSNKVLFKEPPPVINIDSRQHSVTVHFNRKTSHDYLTEATKKVSKIHARLPPGGILVFLTGQQEIGTVCKRLEGRYGKKAIEKRKRDQAKIAERRERRDEGKVVEEDDDEELDKEDATKLKVKFSSKEGDVEAEDFDFGTKDEEDLALDVDDGNQEEVDQEALDTDDESSTFKTHDSELPDQFKDDSDIPLHILPLYSLLPSNKQMKVFENPPENTRLVVVATNVAETSLTIPGIRYVVDCGRSKERNYDENSGIQSFDVNWISKASANQRSGRAGRTGPGHCYRLYSSAVYEDHFKQFSNPEILRTPVDGLVLQMKSMNIDNVINFPFPTPPDRNAIRKAETLLENLGALELVKVRSNGRNVENLRITEIGKNMNLYPVTPRFSKLLAQGDQHGCMPSVVALVAALSVGDPFIREQVLNENDEEDEDESLPEELKGLTNSDQVKKEQKKAKRKRFFNSMAKFEALGNGMSDTFRLLSAVGAYEFEKGSLKFCQDNFLRPKAMEEIHKLRAQLSSLILSVSPSLSSSLLSPSLARPTEIQLKVLRQLLSASFIDQIAVRADLLSSDPKILSLGGQNGAVRKGSKMSSTRGVPYLAAGIPGGVAFIHPGSGFFHGKPPEWITWQEAVKSNSKRAIDNEDGNEGAELKGEREVERNIWLKNITRINPSWISTLGRTLCSFSKPTELPRSNASTSSNMSTKNLAEQIRANKSMQNKVGGSSSETEREVYLTPNYNAGKSDITPTGWELPPVKAKQRLVGGRWLTEME